jgi:predicted DNA-binding protein (MmcQ/YjbR family)
MTGEEVLSICLGKPGAWLDFPFGPQCACVKVGTRLFAQVFLLGGQSMATLNCDRMTGEIYRAKYPGIIIRGYHCPPVQQPYFNTILLDEAPDGEVRTLIDHAYAVVAAKLPRAVRAQL